MFVFSNLATSLDGKIATKGREHFPIGTPADRKNMVALRREADAVLMGASTLRTYRRSLYVSGVDRQPINVIMSATLDGISPEWQFFTDSRISRILFVSSRAQPEIIRKFENSSEIIVLKQDFGAGVNVLPVSVQIIDALSAYGVSRLLVEGGGNVMWDFVSQNLIDEYHVTITPRVIGGTTSPTLVDGLGFDPAHLVNLNLVQSRVVGDELYLIYKKSDRRGP